MERTTIAVREDTLKLLRQAKEDLKADSIDVVIKELLIKSKTPKKSMFGSIKGLKEEFRREEVDRFS